MGMQDASTEFSDSQFFLNRPRSSISPWLSRASYAPRNRESRVRRNRTSRVWTKSEALQTSRPRSSGLLPDWLRQYRSKSLSTLAMTTAPICLRGLAEAMLPSPLRPFSLADNQAQAYFVGNLAQVSKACTLAEISKRV